MQLLKKTIEYIHSDRLHGYIHHICTDGYVTEISLERSNDRMFQSHLLYFNFPLNDKDERLILKEYNNITDKANIKVSGYYCGLYNLINYEYTPETIQKFILLIRNIEGLIYDIQGVIIQKFLSLPLNHLLDLLSLMSTFDNIIIKNISV